MNYTQHGEDNIISQYFPNEYIGGCIEVGASDGIGNSNTKLLEELGWYCLCIEPNPVYFEQLKNNRNHAIKYALSKFNGEATFNIAIIEDCYYHADAISSLEIDERLLNKHKNAGYNISINGTLVEVRTLDYCIENHYNFDKIDFISIDTEGTELDVLKGFSINKWKPKLLIIENNFEDINVEVYLNHFNYIKDKRIDVNDFYIHK